MSKVGNLFKAGELSEWTTPCSYQLCKSTRLFNRIKCSDKSTVNKTKGQCYSMSRSQSVRMGVGGRLPRVKWNQPLWKSVRRGVGLEIHGQPSFEVLRRCYSSGGMASGPRSPWVREVCRTGHRRGSRTQGTPGVQPRHFPFPTQKAGPLSPGRRRPAVVGSGEN